MRKKKYLVFISILSLTLLNQMGMGQRSVSVTDVKEAFKVAFSGGKAERTIVDQTFIYVRWKKGGSRPEIHIRKYDSVEIAKEEFDFENKLIDKDLNGRGKKESLSDIGDEGVIFTELGSNGLFDLGFMRREYYITMFGMSREQATSIAKSLDKILMKQM